MQKYKADKDDFPSFFKKREEVDKSIMQTLKFTWERDICWTDVCVELLRKSDAISAYYGVKNEFRMVKSLTSTDTCISYMVRP